MNVTRARGRSELARALLRSPDSGIAGQGLRYALSGALVAGVYASLTLLLHDAFLLAFQVALAIGFASSVVLHFTLQRLFVWRHHDEFALAPAHQALRYLAMCSAQYGLTSLSTARLPGLFGLPVEGVYATTALILATTNFLVFRGRIFHPMRS